MAESDEKRGVLSARQRRERAAAELRANLAKRKALARVRVGAAQDVEPRSGTLPLPSESVKRQE